MLGHPSNESHVHRDMVVVSIDLQRKIARVFLGLFIEWYLMYRGVSRTRPVRHECGEPPEPRLLFLFL